jgi:hypothetical protein
VKNYLSRVFEKLGVSNRFDLLSLLLNGGNGLARQVRGSNVSGLGNSMETYFKAAEERYAPAQFIVGLALLEGCGVEKNDYLAYYWPEWPRKIPLRLRDVNSSRLRIDRNSQDLTPPRNLRNPTKVGSEEPGILAPRNRKLDSSQRLPPTAMKVRAKEIDSDRPDKTNRILYLWRRWSEVFFE